MFTYFRAKEKGKTQRYPAKQTEMIEIKSLVHRKVET